jgi:Na+/proline symporter
MFCPKCGKDVGNANYCPYCGEDLSKYQEKAYNDDNVYDPINNFDTYDNNNRNYYNENDQSSLGFAVLSFLIPIVGLILFIVWHNQYPKKAKSCLKGAIISVVLSFILSCCMISTTTYNYSTNNDSTNFEIQNYDAGEDF